MLGRLFASPIATLRAFAHHGADSLEARLALARLEWVEERRRLVTAGLGGGIAVLFGFAALIFIGLAVIVGFWETPWRLAAAVAVAIVALLVAAIGAWTGLSALRSPMFSATRAELARDWRTLADSLAPDETPRTAAAAAVHVDRSIH